VIDYRGKRAVVTGGGGAGMGAALVRDLVGAGAEVHVLDLKDPPVAVASHQRVDLRDRASCDAALEVVGTPIHCFFHCAGLPGPPHSGLDTMLVNFVAGRHLALAAAERMPRGGSITLVSSAGAFGIEQGLGQMAELLATRDFDAARAWCDAHPERVAEGYLLSKQAIVAWTFHAALDLAPRGIRVNCISPGPTDTPMMPAFEAAMGKDFMDRFPKPLGRNSTPEEQAHVLAFLGSDLASYVTGVNLYTDGGFAAGMLTGRLDLSVLAGDA
jgi:NAD(P)-dependent dehydrogenase (short-subunit alcohol dehydrogenase family)